MVGMNTTTAEMTALGVGAALDSRDAEIKRLRGVLEEIRNTAFYHMTRHADERGDRKVLGEIKERAIAALKP